MTTPRSLRGFTLIEMIMVIVITGIIAGMVAVFIARPIEGYVDTVRRAGLTDVADLALKRMGLDVRTAIPNSVRLASNSSSSVTSCSAPATATNCFLELIPARTGGRYCADTDTGCNALQFGGSDAAFDVLGTTTDAAIGEFLVVYNTGQAGLNAYAGDNLRTVATGTSTTAITFTGGGLTYASPSNRFQIVPSTGPVTFACAGVGGSSNGTGSLKRYTGYNTGASFIATQPDSFTITGALLADYVSDCRMTYDAVSARNGIVTLRLTITREGESVTLLHQIHVDNMP
jgi:MSHA biogenesis protein MshO